MTSVPAECRENRERTEKHGEISRVTPPQIVFEEGQRPWSVSQKTGSALIKNNSIERAGDSQEEGTRNGIRNRDHKPDSQIRQEASEISLELSFFQHDNTP